MIFETLYESAQRGELMLVDGGMCHWHLRRDGQLTIREIISTKPGAGSRMMERLKLTPGATSLYAKCPANLPANAWYTARGFHVERMEVAPSGRKLICWRLPLGDFERRPNAGDIEVIYCAAGNRRNAEIAIDAGLRYGGRLPDTIYYRPYFIDQEYKAPNRAAYMACAKQHRPHIATVLDLEREEQLPEIMSWAEEVSQYAQVMVLIPKFSGAIARLPKQINGKEVRLGYSVPTGYGGTDVPLSEFCGWPVHLLGGSPARQLDLAHYLDVRSVDCNMIQKLAQNCQWWTPKSNIGRVRHWPALEDVESRYADGPYEALRRSCHNMLQAWRNMTTRQMELHENLRLFA